ncbi:uncharacterized protein ASPGLDRAFT_27367 [Aspergillus glaucus CBS 516.65]|uniref:Uncharacterized protein n=1 Tax=Aspergillus glaucus CBS 516.65 TaxID=1160497 RepID=A0A1L9VF65_ASPGL|nr:hypothetical protein ASPGLDRAFT_27367 [Aspergillus glaucus CBS 516.65]OJJ82535.1 hypothetical protein ASPGLDRAFT_27367 [Aspergillus glaucus CBS 516.65]
MTPITPFRPPASRSNARPQFASTPRFVFSQPQSSSTQSRDGDKDLVDDISNDSPSTVRYADRDTARGDVIEDVEEDEHDTSAGPSIIDEELDSTPPASVELDSEFEDLFGPPERTKRRRISPAPEPDDRPASRDYGGGRDDAILTSSPGHDLQSSWNEEPPVTPFPRRPRPTQQPQFQDEGIPAGTPKPSTPATTKPAFRHHPRFLLSQQPPSSTQSAPASAPIFASQLPSSTPRRKPAFVLPRSPSPSATQEDTASLPTPFSPSSRTLHRRGRARHDVPGYVPGGMAAEVRGWVLEMGTKREQLDSSVVRFGAQVGVDSRKYLVTTRIVKVVRSVLRSSGPVAFVEAELLSEGSISVDDGRRNILLMGSPRSRPGDSELAQGSVVGVYRGLVWEIELDRDGVDALSRKDGVDVGNLGDYQSSNANDRERWLVVMEWDLLNAPA